MKDYEEFYEQLYTNRLDNLGEMDKFVVSYKLPKLNKERIESLNRSITSKETETVIKTSQNSKVQDQAASQVNSTKHSEKIYYPSFSNTFKKTEEERMLPNQLTRPTLLYNKTRQTTQT